jgi:uncharacterized membrane protein
MRTVVILIIMAVLGLAFVAQKRSEQQKVVATEKVAAAQTPSPRPVSEHNWAKHSLDTTNKVIRQVAQQRKADGN